MLKKKKSAPTQPDLLTGGEGRFTPLNTEEQQEDQRPVCPPEEQEEPRE